MNGGRKKLLLGTTFAGLNSPISIKDSTNYMSNPFVQYSSNRYELSYVLGGTASNNFKAYASANNWYLDEVKSPKWTHCAVVFYDNGTWKIFHNGLPVSKGTTLTSYSSGVGTNKLALGFNTALIDEVYVTREALYTESFEVPIAPWSK